MAKVSSELAQAEVVDLDGNHHRLDELWAKRPAVLIFVRHFG
jgi:hypothetical protein